MTPFALNTPDSRRALARAARWRLVSLLMSRPRRDWHQEIEALATEVPDETLRHAARAARDASEGIYLRLFAEGGFVSPRECTWRHREDPGQILADIAGFYEAFAFRPRMEDPTDHVAVETGFVGYLHLKLAHALAQRDEESAEITAQAIVGFLRAHLSLFAERWAERVAATGVPHLTGAAQAMVDSVRLCLPSAPGSEGASGGER
jgi:nitrate reductase assembly molybdenum cofactor insertion protein NarJ